MPGNRKCTTAHLNEHGYRSTSCSRGPGTSRTTVAPNNPTRAANFYLEQRAPTLAQSRENGHLRYYSTSGSTSYSRGRKRRIANRNTSHARSASVSNSQENGHLGYHSASGSTSYIPGRIANRYASHARSAPVSSAPVSNSQENGHLGVQSALGSTSYSRGRKRRIANRNASHATTASVSNQRGTSAPESHRNSQRLQNRPSPLSSSSWNLPSTSSATNPPKTNSRKPSGDNRSIASKRSSFSKGQITVLFEWLEFNLEYPYPTESEKLSLATRARITLNQVSNYFTNARRHSAYKKMCEEQGIIPVLKKYKIPTRSSRENEENQIPLCGRSIDQVPVRGTFLVIRVPVQGSSFNIAPVSAGYCNQVAVGDEPLNQVPVPGSSFNQVPVPSSSFNQVPVPGSSFNLGSVGASSFNQVPVEARSFNQVPVGARSFNQVPVPDRSFNQVPVPDRLFNQVLGHSDSGLSSDDSTPTFMHSSSSSSPASSDLLGPSMFDSPQSESSSSEIEASEDNYDRVFVVDDEYIGINPLQRYPCQHPAFIKGSGFIPAPPLPAGVSPEVFAVSRQVTDPVYIDVPPGSSLIDALFSVAEKHRDADVKAYERNLPRELYIAEELMAENPGAIIHEREPGCDH